MSLKDFLELLLTVSGVKIEIRSAYNDKLLCKQYPTGKKADLLLRKVVAFRPEIDCNSNIAWPVMVVYLHGDVEFEEEMEKRRMEKEHAID